jgi:hypothetical protein
MWSGFKALSEWFWTFLKDYVPQAGMDRLLDSKWGKRFISFLGGAIVTAIGTVTSFIMALGPAWKYGFLGGFISTSVVAIVSLSLSLRKGSIPGNAALSTQPTLTNVIDTPREEIRFDYLPDSPLNHGWKVGYATNPVPPDAVWKAATDAPILGSMTMELSDAGCAIERQMGRGAALSTQFVCDVKFSDNTMLFIRVGLVTRDESQKRHGFIKFTLGTGRPFWTKQWDEWTMPINPPPLGNGWHRLEISISDSVVKTWGQNGWILSELLTIRLRGHLGISPIKLY